MKLTDYNANLLRRFAKIEREGTEAEGKIPDGAGGYTMPWKKVWEGYIDLGPMSGRESVFAQQLQSVVSGRAVMRYHSGITAAMRITFNGRNLNILLPVNVEEAGRWLVLFYDEGGAT